MKKLLLPFIALLFIATISQAQTLTLWGTTNAGSGQSLGTLYNFNTATQKDSTLHDFGAPGDGSEAQGSPLNVNGTLYGLSTVGGADGYGIIYSYNIASGVYSDIHDFGSGTDGKVPVIASLVRVSDSLLYGVTSLGGANDSGTIFSFNIYTDSETDVHDFTGADGYRPIGSLIQVNDSLLFGMASASGAYGNGSIFKYTISSGVETDAYDFAGGPGDGAFPCLGLLQVGDSLLYGMTSEGGEHGYGIIFSYNFLKGDEINKHAFGAGNDGELPYGTFIQVNDSLLYGLTDEGGLYGYGTIFTYNILDDTETDVHDFGNGADGQLPQNSLLMASNKLLYGTTNTGGGNGQGTIFSFNTTTSTENVVYSFGSDTDGKRPFGNLIQVDVKQREKSVSDTICSGSAVTLYASGGSIAYTWYPATGLVAATGDSVIASPTATTVYGVTGNISDTVITVGVDTVVVNPVPPKPYIEQHGDSLMSNATSGNQWYQDDTLVPGATHQVFIIRGEESFYIDVVTDSVTGCSSSDTFTVSGIQQLTLQNYIKTFPNPFSNSVTLSISPTVTGLGNWNLQVTDVLGRTVYTRQSLNYMNEIDLSRQPGGMYFITVMDGTDRVVVPVVKE